MLSALDFVANKLHLSYRQVDWLSSFCSNVRKLGEKSLSEISKIYVNKFLRAVFNRNQPIPPKPSSLGWDINVMLEFIRSLGPNMKLDPWKLAAKTVILTMLTTMCRLDEVAWIQVPDIHRSVAGIRVTLKKPTKNF